MADFTLNMQIEQPRGDALATALEAWVAQVATQSGGRLEIRLFYPGEFVPANDIADAVAAGALDLGWHRVRSEADPTLGVFELPFLGKPGPARSQAVFRLFEDGTAVPSAGAFVSVLAANFGASNQLLLTESRLTPQDLSGFRIAGLPGGFFDRLGATSALISQAELSLALQTALIDGVSIPISDAIALSLDDVVSNGVIFADGDGLRNLTQILTVNADALANLPADLRQILEDTAGETLSAELGSVSDVEQARALRTLRRVIRDVDILDSTDSASWRIEAEKYTQAQLAELGQDATLLHAALTDVLGTTPPPSLPGDGETDGGGANAGAIMGDAGDNSLEGGAGNDRLVGLAGDDTLRGGAGADTLDGGAGFDTVSYAGEARGVGVRLDGGANWGAAAGDVLASIEGLIGTRFADTLIGSNAANRLAGGAGNDRIFGLAGMDTIDGGAGADTLDGGAGFDTVSYASATAGVGARLDGGVNFGAAAGDVLINFEALEGSRFVDALVGSNGNNIIKGGAGADRLFGSFGSDLIAPGDRDGADTVDGGAGFDWLDFTEAGAGVGARLDGGANFGAAAGDRYVAMEGVEGSEFGDVLIGSDGTNVLKGNGGDDRLFGLGGRDGLYGGAGDDTLDGGAGADLLDGGDDFDTISYVAASASVGARLDGGANWGAASGDVIRNAEALIGSRFNDTLIGSAGANTIEGGRGSDRMWGLGGADRFVFAGPGFGSDIVKDFQNGVDMLDFSRHAGVNGIGDLAIFDVGAFVRIDVGADRVFLEGANFADIEAGDFLFT